MSNVVDLVAFRARRILDEFEKKHAQATPEAPKPESVAVDFDAIARQNKENEERLRKERLNDNQKVKRSYRIDNKK